MRAMATEDRIVEIEIKLTAQEDLLQSLNQQVYEQQKQISELRALCIALVRRLGDADHDAGGADAYTVEKPPHY